jgi:thiamine-phosphate pyrophosphorylase
MPLKPLSDCRLYGFVDTAYLHGSAPEDVARKLCDGGADLIQFRAKDWPVTAIRETAERLLPITTQAGVWLVLNDHWETACEIGAPLCHLGQEDFFIAERNHARQLPRRVGASGGPPALGLSTHGPDQALRGIAAGADYIAIGPVYATATKPGAVPVTLDYVRWASQNVSIPWFAIGGINLENLDAVLDAGARRVCVVSAILNAPDVAKACQQFKSRLLSARS